MARRVSSLSQLDSVVRSRGRARRDATRARGGGIVAGAGVGAALLALLISGPRDAGHELVRAAAAGSDRRRPRSCSGRRAAVSWSGATEYGGPGDPSSGTVGAAGDNLLAAPGHLRRARRPHVADRDRDGRAAVHDAAADHVGRALGDRLQARLRLGGGPVDGLPRVIDLWWELAGSLGIPYENGLWSGPVRIERPPQHRRRQRARPDAGPGGHARSGAARGLEDPAACAPGSAAGVPLTPGQRARLLPNGLAAAPSDAPAAVKEIIAAGNQIAGKPYVYGGGHGLPLSEIAPAYDCSSSVEHLLYGARLLPVTYGAAVGQARVVRASRARAVGHALRQRRPRVHVRRRAALGHAQRRRAGRRQQRDRLASAGPQRRRVRRAAPGGAMTALRASRGARGIGAGAARDAASWRPAPSATSGLRRRPRRAPRRWPRPRPRTSTRRPHPPRQRATGRLARRSRPSALRHRVHQLDRRHGRRGPMRALAAQSVGQARSAMELAAAQTAGDYELQARRDRQQRRRSRRSRRWPGSRDQYVVVTRERHDARPTPPPTRACAGVARGARHRRPSCSPGSG